VTAGGLKRGKGETVKYTQAAQGRVFVVRLEDGEVLHEKIEEFAAAMGVKAAALVAVGGADRGSTLVVGPEQGSALPVVPMERVLGGVYEIAGTGTIFPDESGKPVLHMHVACGRKDSAVAGCVRRGVKVWRTVELVLFELACPSARRVHDGSVGFSMLEP
jgi:predicted DNA-binding protein with PD1-like motif